jgi:hypothetical protein
MASNPSTNSSSCYQTGDVPTTPDVGQTLIEVKGPDGVRVSAIVITELNSTDSIVRTVSYSPSTGALVSDFSERTTQ